MDPTRWEIDLYWDWDDDQPEGVALRCLSCASIGTFRVDGETLAHVIDQATQHDRIIHHR